MRNALSHITGAAIAASILFALAGPANAAGASASKQAETLQIEAFDLQDKGDLEGAIAKFRQAHALQPKNKSLNQNLAEVLNATGVTLYNNKDYANAEARLKEAVALMPGFKQAKENLGKVQCAQYNMQAAELYKAGNLEAAKAKFADAVAADPTNTYVKANLANAEADLLARGTDLESKRAALAKRREASGYAPDNAGLKQRLAEAESALADAEAAAKAEEEKKKDD